MRRLAYGFLWLLVFNVPWEEAITVPGVGGLSKIFGAGALLCAILSSLSIGHFRPLNRRHLLIILFVLWNAISILWTIDLNASLEMAQRFLGAGLLVFLIWELASSEREQTGLLQAYIWGCWLAIMTLPFQPERYHVATLSDVERPSGGGLNPNDSAIVMAMGLIIALFLATERSPRRRLVRLANWAFCPVAICVVALSGSRAGLIAVLLGVGLAILVFAGIRLKYRIAFVILVFLATLAIPYAVPMETQERLLGTPEAIETGDLTHRREVWREALAVFPTHAILGTGSGTFPYAIPPVAGARRVAHNAFISVLVTLGSLGVILFLLILLSTLAEVLTWKGDGKSLWLILFAVWTVGALSLSWEYRKPTWFLIGLASAWCAPLAGRFSHRPRGFPAPGSGR